MKSWKFENTTDLNWKYCVLWSANSCFVLFSSSFISSSWSSRPLMVPRLVSCVTKISCLSRSTCFSLVSRSWRLSLNLRCSEVCASVVIYTQEIHKDQEFSKFNPNHACDELKLIKFQFKKIKWETYNYKF